MADVRQFPKKAQQKNVTHVARVDLIPLAALYYLHIERDVNKAASLINAFSTQALDKAAIELTQEQYTAFKAATARIVDTITASYEAYIREADSRW